MRRFSSPSTRSVKRPSTASAPPSSVTVREQGISPGAKRPEACPAPRENVQASAGSPSGGVHWKAKPKRWPAGTSSPATAAAITSWTSPGPALKPPPPPLLLRGVVTLIVTSVVVSTCGVVSGLPWSSLPSLTDTNTL